MWHWFVLSYFSGDAFQGELIGNLIFWCCRFGSPLLVQLSYCVGCLCLHLVWNAHTFAASSPRLSSRPLLGSVLHMDCHSFLEYVSISPPWNAQTFPALETRGPAMNRICSTTFFWQCFLPPARNMNESFCSALIAFATRVLINELLPCVCSLQGFAGLRDGSESVWKSQPALLQFSQ